MALRNDRILLALMALLVARSASAEWVDWVIEGALDARFDSNLNHASLAAEEDWDVSFDPGLEVGRVFQLGERTRLLPSLELGGEIYSRFTDLDSFAADVGLALLHKFGLGDAPWARLFASGGYRVVGDDHRSGARFAIGIAVGKRFSPRLDAKLSYRFARRWGGDGPPVVATLPDDVFDQVAHQISLDGSFLATEQALLTLGFSYLRGDFDSNARSNRMEILALDDVEAVARDVVFGGWVYRIRGNGYSPFVRLSYGLGSRWSLGLDYRFQYAEGGGLDYRNHSVGGVVLFRY